MKRIILKIALFAAALGPAIDACAQEWPKNFGRKVMPCGSSEYEAMMQAHYPGRANTAEFEAWLAPKVKEIRERRLNRARRGTDNILTIPVVVHIIHNGDAIGSGENITDAQVYSQITVLNQDYRRVAGSPGFNDNPVGADTEIQFCMAQQDPNGLATTGIVRHQFSETTWNVNNIDQVLKPATQWDPNLYLNLWIVNDITIDLFGMPIPGIKGYAQFPSMSGLEGLDGEQDIANMAGVVIGHKYFGSPLIYPEGTYDSDDVRGRTATHEIGHFLGLRHIWGDGDCTMDDFCEDTPEAAEATQGTCPSGVDSCPDSPGEDMVENYMDYSSEGCMNIFTLDQKDRMVAVLQNSPRRAQLTASVACNSAQEHENDGSLHIEEIEIAGCSNTFSPVLRLFNAGTSTLTSAQIGYWIDNGPMMNYNWSGSLEHGQEIAVTLPELTASSGLHDLNASITSVNGGADPNNFNNTRSYPFRIAQNIDIAEIMIEVQQDAFGSETTWELTNSSGTVVASGGPYENVMDPEAELPVHTEIVEVADNECYTFTIEDEGGNGLVGIFGQGYYFITSGMNNVIGQGGMFADQDSVSFGVNLVMAKDEAALQGITLYPVPSENSITIDIPQHISVNSCTVFNNLGQVVDSRAVAPGSITINIQDWAKGVYYVKVGNENATSVLPFIKK